MMTTGLFRTARARRQLNWSAFFPRIAGTMTGGGSAPVIDAVAVRMTPFLRPSLPSRDRPGMVSFKAVGQRNAGAMADIAQALLKQEKDLPEGPLSYAVATGMLGNIAQGKGAESLRLWETFGSRLIRHGETTLLFRMLKALSKGESSSQ